ncbi:MAG: cupredoxin domain-containing protein [Chloroflexi bacterium]|nr:cupredoxin domain-containing protein [Chloroflexota bacterium]
MKLTVGFIAVALLFVILAAVVAMSLVLKVTAPPPPAASVAIALEDLRFTPNRIDARVGVPVTLLLTNRGLERHDLSFPALHMPGLQGVEAILEPGETRTVTLTFDRPGAHAFICTLPGHAASGMTGAAYVIP